LDRAPMSFTDVDVVEDRDLVGSLMIKKSFDQADRRAIRDLSVVRRNVGEGALSSVGSSVRDEGADGQT
jgi:hypothetical protein